jgi:hypothetical protein
MKRPLMISRRNISAIGKMMSAIKSAIVLIFQLLIVQASEIFLVIKLVGSTGSKIYVVLNL